MHTSDGCSYFMCTYCVPAALVCDLTRLTQASIVLTAQTPKQAQNDGRGQVLSKSDLNSRLPGSNTTPTQPGGMAANTHACTVPPQCARSASVHTHTSLHLPVCQSHLGSFESTRRGPSSQVTSALGAWGGGGWGGQAPVCCRSFPGDCSSGPSPT